MTDEKPVAENIARFSGFADCYSAHRPAPPAALVDVLTQLAQASRPRLVVDVGSGTGLSTRIWARRAEEAIGVEPNPDMHREAESQTAVAGTSGSVAYPAGRR